MGGLRSASRPAVFRWATALGGCFDLPETSTEDLISAPTERGDILPAPWSLHVKSRDELHRPPFRSHRGRAGHAGVPTVEDPRCSWIVPAILTSVLIFLMTLIYVGSVVDPLAHLHGLPVLIVDEDAGSPRHVDAGQHRSRSRVGARALGGGLEPALLGLPDPSQAKASMDVDGAYATLVIPRRLHGINGGSVRCGPVCRGWGGHTDHPVVDEPTRRKHRREPGHRRRHARPGGHLPRRRPPPLDHQRRPARDQHGRRRVAGQPHHRQDGALPAAPPPLCPRSQRLLHLALGHHVRVLGRNADPYDRRRRAGLRQQRGGTEVAPSGCPCRSPASRR